MKEEWAGQHVALMIESIADALFAVDKQWRFTYLNQEAERILIKKREELIGKNMWNEFPIEMVSIFQSEYFKAVAEQHPVKFEGYFSTYKKWFEVRATPFAEGLCVYLHDITERKKSDERVLRALETNNHLAAAIANTVMGVTISDPKLPDNPLIFANKGFEKLTGYQIQEVLGVNCRFLQGKETDQEAIDQIKIAIQERTPITVELLNYRKDGRSFWNELTISPVFDESGDLLYFVGLQADVTRRKKAEQVLQSELELAKLVQESVLSPPLYEKRLEMEAAYIPSEQLAGDMYCWYRIDKHRYGIMLLDVVGHGISASLISMSVRSLLQGLITRLTDPIKVIKELNRHMNNLYAGHQRLQAYYFTCIYIVVDTQKRTIEYVNAGHPPAIICTAEGETARLDQGSLPVGIVPDLQVDKGRISYTTSARIVLYTDGLIESTDYAAFDIVEQLQTFFLERVHIPTADITREALTVFIKEEKRDDVCLLVLTAQ